MIITVGREFGSGGRELAKRIADELNINYYDKEIIYEVAKNTNLSYEYVHQIIEKAPNTFYQGTIGNSFNYYAHDLIKTIGSVQKEQENVIKELAQKGDCVIVGRCADYILKEMHPYRIFVYSDMASKIKRCMEKGEVDISLNNKKLAKMIKNVDRHRKKYYEFYTNQKWGDIMNYDICINTSGKNIKDVVNEIIKIFKSNN